MLVRLWKVSGCVTNSSPGLLGTAPHRPAPDWGSRVMVADEGRLEKLPGMLPAGERAAQAKAGGRVHKQGSSGGG